MPKKILLAEDDQFTRYMMGEVFGALGYEYDMAKDGRECEHLIVENPGEYGVILMDIHMPNVSGVDATRAIRSNPNDPPKSVPIIAVTADADYYDARVIKDRGMDGWLQKPIIASEVNEVVARYCLCD